MGLQSFIPQLWADTLLAALRKNLVFGNIVNHDYEGQIKAMGDTVRINAIGDITISSYSKDTYINAPQALTSVQTQLVISQSKYYNFAVDDVDKAQNHPQVMGEAMSWAAYRLADTIDQYIAGFSTAAVAANLVGSSSSFTTPVVPTSTNGGGGQTVYDYLVVLGQYLRQQSVPRQDRFCVVPPWITTLLTQDIRWTSFNTPDARTAIQKGIMDDGGNSDAYLGQIDGMDVWESVNAPHLGGTSGASGSQDVVIAGHSMALTFANGLAETEAYRPPYRFSDAVKGLSLYGAKTVRPYALAVAYLQHP